MLAFKHQNSNTTTGVNGMNRIKPNVANKHANITIVIQCQQSYIKYSYKTVIYITQSPELESK